MKVFSFTPPSLTSEAFAHVEINHLKYQITKPRNLNNVQTTFHR